MNVICFPQSLTKLSLFNFKMFEAADDTDQIADSDRDMVGETDTPVSYFEPMTRVNFPE